MTEFEASTILLVHSVEECDANAFPADTLTDALREAGDPADETSWFTCRATYLLTHLPAPYHSLLRITQAPDQWIPVVWTVALVLGLAANYLGPTDQIHAIFNPILILVAWNLLVYAFLGAQRISLWDRRPLPPSQGALEEARPELQSSILISEPTAPHSPSARRSQERPAKLPWMLRIFFRDLWIRGQDWGDQAQKAKMRASTLRVIAKNFSTDWLEIISPLILSRWRRTLHVSAIGIAIGAVLGSYVRGLFFEYNVVWRSTFIRDASDVALLLNVLLAPAVLLSGRSLMDEIDVAQLMSPGGAPAAPWIHLYALTAFVLIVIPRATLAFAGSIRIRRLARHVQLNFDDDYFRDRINPARELQVQQYIKQIQTVVRIERAKFSEAVATFVREKLYDDRIVPELHGFRTNGGKIASLEDRIKLVCDAFATELNSYVAVAQQDFEQSLSTSLERTIGESLTIPTDLDNELRGANPPRDAADPLSDSLSSELTTAISLIVAAALTTVIATISGGLGKTLGIAIITALFGTTGPIGFLIGALIGLVVAAAGLWLGREKITEGVKNVDLPGWITERILWTSRLQRLVVDGRVQCHDSVKKQIDHNLEPLDAKIAEEIWMRMKPLLRKSQGA